MSAKRVKTRAARSDWDPEAKTPPAVGEQRVPGTGEPSAQPETPTDLPNPFLRSAVPPEPLRPEAPELGTPAGRSVPGWGGSPTPIPSAHQCLRPVTVEGAHGGLSPAGSSGFPVAALLRARPKERAAHVQRALDGAWVGRRFIAVSSLFGGTGASTLAALLWARLRRLQLPAVLIDATGGYVSGIGSRVPPAALMQGPSWATMSRLDPGRAAREFAERFPGGIDDPPAMVVGGDGHEQRPPGALAVHATRAALATWPLVIADVAADFAAIRDVAGSGQPDLLLMTCRPDSSEVRATADFLRSLDRDGVYAPQDSAVIAIVHGPRVHRDVLAARASAADIAAGVVTIRFTERLLDRTAHVSGAAANDSIDLLAAAAAICHQQGGTL